MLKNVVIVILSACVLASLFVHFRDDGADESKPPTANESNPPEPSELEVELGALIDSALAVEGMEGAAVGLCVIEPDGTIAFDRDALTAFIPASSLKTLTTATALEILGPSYQVETQVKATAAMVDGVIDGDIVLLGAGDPMLGIGSLESMAGELKVGGLRQITGRVIGSGILFEGSIFGDFWNWGDVGNGYGSGVSGLNIEHNRFSAELRQGSGMVGDPADLVGVTPEVPGVRIVNETRLAGPHSGDGVTIYGGERTDTIFLRGTVPANGFSLRVDGAVPDPALFAAYHFKKSLPADGEAVGVYLPDDLPRLADDLLARKKSPQLIDIVRSIHRTSDNHETECVYQWLGLKARRPPAEVIRAHWAERGLAFSGLRMVDGSGLSRADFITPYDLARLQQLAGQGPMGEVYRNSLMSRDDDKLAWKGGAMSSVRSYAGFATGADGEDRCFALMVNHYTDSKPVAELREAVWAVLRGLGSDEAVLASDQ